MGALGRLLLAEGEAEIADVRARILSALGPNIGSLATVPELAALLDLPPVRPEAAAVSLGDWDVLTALGASTSGARATTTLAAQIGWERSPLSHHAKRMAGRGLLELQTSATDRRATQFGADSRRSRHPREGSARPRRIHQAALLCRDAR
jgi:hypothetical protein